MDITLSQAIEGYMIHAEARQLAPGTMADYTNTFQRFLEFVDDVSIHQISKRDVERFIISLGHFKNKTQLNYHIGLSALWTWLVDEELVKKNVVRQVRPPKPEKTAIVPFTEQDLKLMMASLNRSKAYRRPGQAERSNHGLQNSLRNQAILLLLLDTGIRASELCDLRLQHADLRNRRVKIFGKGSKERIVPISVKTAKAIWRYLTTRPDAKAQEPLFASMKDGQFLKRNALRLLLERLGDRAGVPHVHAHRFRHTFAIAYLRNNGDAFTLQSILGHSDMTMTRRYLEIAMTDVESRHQIASPVANWNIG
jgi:site-specific recombinase XerD